MNFIKRNILLFVVFLTGAAVLILEITATRILSPYFGNTIYTVSSVITTILAALSLGYYIGGRLADKYPFEKLFYSIILLSGLNVFFLNFLINTILPNIAYDLSFVTGPLLTSLILFLIPSFLLGMLSPFAIKLQNKKFPKEGVGKLSGEVFFASTVGSIIGSLLAGFYLIPTFGINQIIFTTAFLLTLLGLVGLFYSRVKKKTLSLFVLTSLFFTTTSFAFLKPNLPSYVIYFKDGVYERLSIYDSQYNEKPTRYFQQDRSSSSAMFLENDELVFDYTKYYIVYKLTKPKIKKSLVIGAGVYSIPKKLLQESSEVVVDVVEIEPSLPNLAKKYFNLQENPRLNTFIKDGRRFLQDTDEKYDLIFSDAYSSLFSVPSHMTTIEFFQLVKDHLTDEGIFVANIIGDLSRQKPSFVFSEMRTFKQVFPNSYFFAVESPKSALSQNLIFLAINSDKLVNLKIDSNNEILTSLEEKIIDIDRFDLHDYPLLTDNFAPVDYLTAGSIKRYSETKESAFLANEAYELIKHQLSYGARHPGSDGHSKVVNFIKKEMQALSDEVILQEFNYEKYKLTNIIARFLPEKEKRLILATHFDSKKYADKDSKNPDKPVPCANDSASGTAVIIELARMIATSNKEFDFGIDIIFFDAEEGNPELKRTFNGWQPLGSKYFADNLNEIYPAKKPFLAIIIDMVCDKNLNIYKEKSSQNFVPDYYDKFFEIALNMYPNNFFDQVSQEVHDDHTSLNQAGIPSFLIIDFDYPYFHTTADTPDKCSAESLEKVGKVLWQYLTNL